MKIESKTLTPEEVNQQRLKDLAIANWLKIFFYFMGTLAFTIYVLNNITGGLK